MPEIVSTNRNPQLRDFIDEIIQFLSNTYVRETEIDLFEYKFYNKVANEILFLTNLFEDESAAFTFTLDESYSIKSHLRSKILELRSIHKDFRSTQYEYIHSISSLNDLLGDVRFFDQDYHDAITAYSDALQELRRMDDSNAMRAECVLLLIQLKLKLGLTFEKIKSYDHALGYFTDAMEHTLQTVEVYYANPNPVPSPPSEPAIGSTWQQAASAPLAPVSARKISIQELLQVSVHAFTANLYLMEKMSAHGVDLAKINATLEVVYPMLKKANNPVIWAKFLRHLATLVYYKNMFVYDIRLQSEHRWYQEERIPIGQFPDFIVPDKHIWRIKDYRFPNFALWLNVMALHQLLKHYRVMLSNANGIGMTLKSDWISMIISQAFEAATLDELERISNKNLLKDIATLLSKIGDILLTNIEASNSLWFHMILPPELLEHGMNLIEGTLDPKLFNKVLLESLEPVLEKGVTGDLLNRFRFLLACYYMAGRFYSLAGKIASCSYQYRRILRVITSVAKFPAGRDPKQNNAAELSGKMIRLLEHTLLREILKNTSINSNTTDRVQIKKFKYYFNMEDLYNDPQYARTVYSSISNNPEIREIIILFAEMKLHANRIHVPEVAPDLWRLLDEQNIVNSTNIIASQWIRLLELRLQHQINAKLLTEYWSPLFDKYWPYEKRGAKSLLEHWREDLLPVYSFCPGEVLVSLRSGRDDRVDLTEERKPLQAFFRLLRKKGALSQPEIRLLVQFRELVVGSIHCLNHTLEILQTYGTVYPAGFSFTGDTNRYHARWMKYMYLMEELESSYPVLVADDKPVSHQVQVLIGRDNFRTIDPYSLCQAAQLFYYRALELHFEGPAYKTYIENLNYLDDDFNDSMDHFAAALERQRINSGAVRRHIQEMDKLLRHSQLFKYDSYVNGAGEGVGNPTKIE